MGLFDWLKKKSEKPIQLSGAHPEEVTDPEILRQAEESLARWEKVQARRNQFDASAATLRILYTNHKRQQKTFECSPRGLYVRGNHLVVRVAPSGARISLHLTSIENRDELQSLIANSPHPKKMERRILNYHILHGTTSPRFEELRRKYPNYDY